MHSHRNYISDDSSSYSAQETIACGGGAHLIAVLLLCTLGEQAIKRMSDLFARQMRKVARQQREDMIAMIMQLRTGHLMPPTAPSGGQVLPQGQSIQRRRLLEELGLPVVKKETGKGVCVA